MKLAGDWFKSKMLWTAVAPAVAVAVDGVVSGQMKLLHGALTVVGALGAFALRDTVAKHKEASDLTNVFLNALLMRGEAQHAERMGTINNASAAHGRAAAAVIEKAQLFQEAADLIGASKKERDAAHEENGEADA